MNRKRWIRSMAMLLITLLLVTASIFAPVALLGRQEKELLGRSHTMSNSTYAARTHAPVAATPQPSAAPPPEDAQDRAVPRIRKYVYLLERKASTHLVNEPQPGDIQMKQAASRAMDQLSGMMKKGIIPPLADFPFSYDFDAVLLRLSDGMDELDYWNITFTSNRTLTKETAGVNLFMDADTGVIFSCSLWGPHNETEISPEKAALSMVENLGLKGQISSIPREEGTQRAIWVSEDKSLLFILNLSTGMRENYLTFSFGSKTMPVIAGGVKPGVRSMDPMGTPTAGNGESIPEG